MLRENSHLANRQNYDRLSHWYDSFSASERLITQTGLTLLGAQPGEKILEIGFGTGHALIELVHSVGETGLVCGIDLSPGMIGMARQHIQHIGNKGKIHLQLGDATCLPFSSHQFQAIFISFTLELFAENEIPVVLAECRRVLQHGGRLAIVSLLKNGSRSVMIYDWFHARFPGIVDCRPIFVPQVLETAGFRTNNVVKKTLWGLPAAAIISSNP